MPSNIRKGKRRHRSPGSTEFSGRRTARRGQQNAQATVASDAVRHASNVPARYGSRRRAGASRRGYGSHAQKQAPGTCGAGTTKAKQGTAAGQVAAPRRPSVHTPPGTHATTQTVICSWRTVARATTERHTSPRQIQRRQNCRPAANTVARAKCNKREQTTWGSRINRMSTTEERHPQPAVRHRHT